MMLQILIDFSDHGLHDQINLIVKLNLTSLFTWYVKSHIQHFVRLHLFVVQLDKEILQNVFAMIFTAHIRSRVASSISSNRVSSSGLQAKRMASRSLVSEPIGQPHYKTIHNENHSPCKAVWQIPNLIIIAYKKYLSPKANTVSRFLLFWIKYLYIPMFK